MIVITGASSGIGEACARTLALEGQDLVLIARRADRLKALAKDLQDAVTVHPFCLDVQNKVKVAAWGKENAELLSKCTALINNAGLAKGLGPLQDTVPEEWDVMIDTNLKGLLYVTHQLLPHFIKAKRGHVLNIGSVAGRWVYPKGNVYCATKAAVGALTEAMRLDLHGMGVRVTNIAPGMVKTDFSLARFGDPERAAAVYRGVDALQAQDIAEAVSWCLNRPQHVNIQELVIFPTDQASTTMVHRK